MSIFVDHDENDVVSFYIYLQFVIAESFLIITIFVDHDFIDVLQFDKFIDVRISIILLTRYHLRESCDHSSSIDHNCMDGLLLEIVVSYC